MKIDDMATQVVDLVMSDTFMNRESLTPRIKALLNVFYNKMLPDKLIIDDRHLLIQNNEVLEQKNARLREQLENQKAFIKHLRQQQRKK